ncbi:MAG: glycosyltransferase family 39 protein [bacterium]
MAKQQKQQSAPQISLFPFFSSTVNDPRFPWWLLGCYLFIMLMINFSYHTVGDYGVETDFFWSYVPQAREIMKGTLPIENFHGPAYPIILAIVSLLTKDLFHAGIFLATLCAAFTLYFAFNIFKQLFRSDIALVGTILIAVNPTFVQYTYSAGTDMLFAATVTASMYFLMKDSERRWQSLIISALLGAFAYLNRYNGFYIVLAAPAAILIANPFSLSWKERVKTCALYLGVFFLAIAPWGIYCLLEKGSFFFSKNYLNIAYEMFAKERIGWDQFWSVESKRYTSLSQVIFLDFGLFIKTVIRNVYFHFLDDLGKLLGWQTGAFTFFGVIYLFFEKPEKKVLSFLILSLSFFGILLLVFYGERFSLALLPVYSLLALRTLTLPNLVKYRFWKAMHLGGIISIIIILWTFNNSYSFNKMNISSGPQEMVVIADQFKSRFGSSESGKIILARKPHIAYYLDMQMETFPYVATLPELFAAAKSANASYLYFSQMEAAMRPQFEPLLNPRNAPPQLKAVLYTDYPPAVLYKLELDQQ